MNKFYSKGRYLLLFFLCAFFTNSSFSQLIISQYYEGASYNKFIELTNVGSQDVDLSKYKLSCWYSSKSGRVNIDFKATPINYALSGSLSSGETIVLRNNRTTTTSINFVFPKEIKLDTKFNGNDGIALVNSEGDLIDIGINNVYGANKSYVRNFDVNTPNTTYDTSEWTKLSNAEVISASMGDANRLGYHVFSSSKTVSTAKDIKSFLIDGKLATINTSNNTIEISFYNDKDISALIPSIAISGKASISPASAISQDFTKAVVYTLTAEDKSTKQYTVNVSLIEKSNDPLVINELDYNQVGSDTKEFVELYDGGKGNISLEGYILVMYNGKGNKSYLAYDLSEYTTNENGFFVLGSPLVSNVDFSPRGFNLQNGPDAVALYKGNISQFSTSTLLTSDNLVDIVVYGDSNVAEMTNLLIEGSFIDGSLSGDLEHHSIYRLEDGLGGALNTSKFTAGIPTPGISNLALSTYPTLTLSSSTEQATESDKTEIIISVASSKMVDYAQNVTISLTGDRVSDLDFATVTNILTIPANTNSASITYTVVDDSDLEGPEVFNFKIKKALKSLIGDNNPVPVVVIDNDGSIRSSFGTPTNPTYTNVGALYNTNLYSSLNGKSGDQLRLAIQAIIANKNTKGQNYGDIWDMLKLADQNPENPFEVWLIYLEKGLKKTQQDGHATGEVWNREHVWCQSLGSYKNGTSSSADGIDKYFSTSVDQLKHGHADGHHLRSAQKNENSSRGNKSFDDVDGALTSNTKFYEPPLSAKGDIARSIMYMAVRFNGLTINEEAGVTGSKSIGKLSTLLKWHTEDPVDDFERNRNNKIAEWQNNRNPFIDNPTLVNYIYGNAKTKVWNSTNTLNPIISINENLEINFVYNDKITDGVKQYIITAYQLSENLILSTEGKIDISTDGKSWSHEISIQAASYLNKNIYVRVSGDQINTTTPELAVINHVSGDLSKKLNVICGIKSDKASQEITFGVLFAKTYGDSDFELSSSSTSSLAISYRLVSGPASISGNTVSITGAGTVEIEASQAGNDNFLAATFVVRSFEVLKASQAITFNAISAKTYGDTNFELSSSSSSLLEISYRLVSGSASISGNTVSITGAGTVEIEASQAGDDNFLAARLLVRSFEVSKASQTITFNVLSDKTYGDSDFELSSSSSSSLAISYRVVSGSASISGNTVSITGAGTIEIEASQAGNENFLSATPLVRSFEVFKASQAITFNAISATTYGDSDFELSSSSTSSLAISYRVVSGSASISGNTVSITGSGTVEIEASQAGNGIFLAATPVVRRFEVSKASQAITFNAISAKTYGDSDFELSSNSTSSLVISYRVLNGPASISGNTVSIIGAGTVEIEASQIGNDNFLAATLVVRSFEISKANQEITFNAIPTKTYGDSSFDLSASSSSLLVIGYRILSGPAEIKGSTISITGAGIVEVEAFQIGNNDFLIAPIFVRSFIVKSANLASKTNQKIVFEELSNKIYGDSSFELIAKSDSGLNINYNILLGNVSIENNILTIYGAGMVKIEALQLGNDIYNSAPSVIRSFDVLKVNQAITFNAISAKTYGDTDFELVSNSTSSLAISYRVVNGSASINGNTVSITGVGTVEVEASQAGNDNFLAATLVVRSFEVSKASQAITFNAISAKTYGDTDFELVSNSTSSLAISYRVVNGPVSISGNTVSITGAGTVEVEASQAGNDNFLAATLVVRSFEVSKASQAITFNAISAKTYGDTDFELSSSSTSSLAISYRVVNGSASISGNTVSITGAGTVDIEASQDGNDNFLAATLVVRSFEVSKASQAITFNAISAKTYGDTDFELSSSSTSSLAISYRVVNGSSSISGNTVSITGAGTVEIEASQDGNDNFLAATLVVRSFEVSKASQAITFNAISAKTYGDSDFELSSNSTSSLAISYRVVSGPASISGNTVSITGAGTVDIEASQAGNDNFLAATLVVRSFEVLKASQAITFATRVYDVLKGDNLELPKISSVGLDLSYEIISGEATLDNNIATILEVGELIVKIYNAGSRNYKAISEQYEFYVSQTTSINEMETHMVNLYPNPASDFLYLDMYHSLTADIFMYNNFGVLVKSAKAISKVRFVLTDLPNGLYIIKIKSANFDERKKIIINR